MEPVQATQPERLLTLAEVIARTARSKSRIYADIKANRFPKPVRDGSSTRFLESEIDSWIAQRRAERDAKAAA